MTFVLGRAAQEGTAPDAISRYDAIVREGQVAGGAVGPEFDDGAARDLEISEGCMAGNGALIERSVRIKPGTAFGAGNSPE